MIFYTDGATSNNGKENAVGGWAFVGLDERGKLIYGDSGSVDEPTNNICELIAVLMACQCANKEEKNIIYSDSAYIVNCYKDKWYKNWEKNNWKNSKKKPVANKFLWTQIIPYFENENFSFEKVEGHKDNFWNNIVDKMAVEAKCQ